MLVPAAPPEGVVPPTSPGIVEPAVPPEEITASIVASLWDEPADLLQAHPATNRQPIAQSGTLEHPPCIPRPQPVDLPVAMLPSLASGPGKSVFFIAETFRNVSLVSRVL
jgi:hypothetical protein